MTQLTDEMIVKNMQAGTVVGIFFAVIFLLIGTILLVVAIKKALKNNKLSQAGEPIPKSSTVAIRIMGPMITFFMFIGICFLIIAIGSASTAKSFTVAVDTIEQKDMETHFRHNSGGKAKHEYYFYLTDLGKMKVTSSRYDKCSEGEEIIVVLDKKNKIQKIYSADEYEYVGLYQIN